jgi:hypothetical protein
VNIADGLANPLKVDIMGSGNFTFGGTAVDPHVSSFGSGTVKIKAYKGHMSSSGMADVDVGISEATAEAARASARANAEAAKAVAHANAEAAKAVARANAEAAKAVAAAQRAAARAHPHHDDDHDGDE